LLGRGARCGREGRRVIVSGTRCRRGKEEEEELTAGLDLDDTAPR
jgi:hypothetical protein